MRMNPDDFFRSFVLGNYSDFLDQPDNVRRGINASVSAFHMADQYYYYYKRNEPTRIIQFNEKKDFFKFLSKKTKYFNDIQSIANAYKHLYLNSALSYVSIDSAG